MRQNLEVQGTDYVLSAVGVGALHAGRSLTNGTNSDGRAELYVGGHIKTYASFDNFGQAYIGDYIEAGTKYDCVTYASGQNSTGPSIGNSTGVAVDSENNSVLLAGGYIYASDASAKTSVLVRKNAVLYSGQSVRTTRNFIVGNAFFKDGKTSENGAQQFEYLKSYNGLNTSLNAYVISDISDKAALQVVADSTETVYQNQIKYSDVKGKVYDQYGEKYNVSVGDYVVFKRALTVIRQALHTILVSLISTVRLQQAPIRLTTSSLTARVWFMSAQIKQVWTVATMSTVHLTHTIYLPSHTAVYSLTAR